MAWVYDSVTREYKATQPPTSFQKITDYSIVESATIEPPAIVTPATLPEGGTQRLIPIQTELPLTLVSDPTTGEISTPVVVPGKLPAVGIKFGNRITNRDIQAIAIVQVDIESDWSLQPTQDESFTIDIGKILDSAIILSAMSTTSGLNYRRITMAFVGFVVRNVLIENLLSLNFRIYNIPTYGQNGDTLAMTMSLNLFGQNYASALIAVPRIAMLATPAIGPIDAEPPIEDS